MEGKDSGIHQTPLRLNRFLAMAGLGSRRKMDDLISSGRVSINGDPVESLGVQVTPGKDRVEVDGRVVEIVDRFVYILLNKPKDTITTLSDERNRNTVMDFVKVKQRVYPIGRLDRNTTGVLLMTNDGDFAQALLHPKYEIERMYKVTLANAVTPQDLRKLRRGVRLDDGVARPKHISVADKSRKKVIVTLTEGRNREVRRMFEACGNDVRQLDRISYAGLHSLGVPRGSWRFLTNQEIRALKDLIGQSKSPRRRRGA